MIHEPFTSGSSFIHGLDPRIKILGATAFSLVVALSSHFPALICSLLLSFSLVVLARLEWREVLKRLLLVNGLVLLFWVLLPVTYRGEPLFHIGPLVISRPGIFLCARITFKSNTIVLALIALVATTPMATIGHALSTLHVPEKIVHLLLLTYRYIFVIEYEFQRLAKASKIRGFQPKTNMRTYKTYAYFMGMLFVRASARAERVHQAMLCRGFKGKFYCLRDFSLTPVDLIWSLCMTVALIGVVVLEWMKTILS